jgi:hypothetical protein
MPVGLVGPGQYQCAAIVDGGVFYLQAEDVRRLCEICNPTGNRPALRFAGVENTNRRPAAEMG